MQHVVEAFLVLCRAVVMDLVADGGDTIWRWELDVVTPAGGVRVEVTVAQSTALGTECSRAARGQRTA